MKDWHTLKPELFKKQPYYRPGCDSYAMNANLIRKWLRDPRFSSEDQAADLPVYEGATFLPVEVAGMKPAPAAPISPNPSTGFVTAQRIDITLSDGRRILVEGATALSAVLAMVGGLVFPT
jgi:transposase